MATSFVWYESFTDALEDLPDEIELQVRRAVDKYALYDESPEIEGIARAIFKLIKPQLDANKKRRDNGRRGGAPMGNDNAQKQAKTTGIQPNTTEPEPRREKKQPNVNANANANANAVEEPRATRQYIKFYAENMGVMSPVCVREAESLLADGFTDEMIVLALKTAVENNAKNWKYAKAILRSWLEKGIKTPEQAAAEQTEFKNKRQRGRPMADKKAFEQHNYTSDETEKRRFAAVQRLADE